MEHVDIGAGKWLAPTAAASYARMRAAGMPAGVTSAGRTAAEQQYLRDLYLSGQGSYALPPEKSLHVAGLALDLPGHIADPTTPRGWIRAHGFNHGWTAVANEPWHHEYAPTLDTHQEDDMTPELTARLDQIVAWLDGRLNHQDRRITQVVAWLDGRLNTLDATAIAELIPAEIAEQVIEKLKERL